MHHVRAYTQLVNGLTEVTRQRARDSGVLQVAEGAAASARTLRQVLLELVRAEVAQSVEALGLASSSEVDRLRRRVEALERAVDRLRRGDADDAPTPADMPAVAHPPAEPSPAPGRTATRKTETRKTATRKTAAPRKTTAPTTRAATRKASG